MGIFDSVVRMFRGEIDPKTQRVTWSESTVEYTSAFMSSVVMFIAREFSKLTINHKIYKQTEDGKYVISDKLGSSEFEVLNYAPNGYKTNREWKREIARRLMNGRPIYLKPIRQGEMLKSLEFTDATEYEKHPDDILCVTSPIFVSNNASLYDRILTNIGQQLESNKLRGFLKINAAIDSHNSNFKEVALKQIQAMQEVATYNGLGVLDGKAELVELKNDYGPVSPEAVAIIKREILNGFGFSEKLITGDYTEDDYKHFYNNVLAPIVMEFEDELTYKLLTNNARVNNGKKLSFERLTVSKKDIFRFASLENIIKLAEANTNGAFMTVNEIRRLMGEDPIEGGDVFRSNLNSVEVKYGEDDEQQKDGGDERADT